MGWTARLGSGEKEIKEESRMSLRFLFLMVPQGMQEDGQVWGENKFEFGFLVGYPGRDI